MLTQDTKPEVFKFTRGTSTLIYSEINQSLP